MKKLIPLLIFTLLFTSFGCLRTKDQPAKKDKIELVYYKLFDNEEIFTPLIQEFESKYKHIKIKYKKFTDPKEYEDLIINELAEGEGPDIFSIHNTWITKHRKKLTSLPKTLITPEEFRNTFVKVAADDSIRIDENNEEQIYSVPLTIDTLALYYNEEYFEDKIPSKGKPSEMWEDLKEDVFKLTKKDKSFERFEIAGIAMGRSDNILRAVDILYMLMIQNKTEFYNEDYAEAVFSTSQGISSEGKKYNPGQAALELYTTFALPSSKYYCWNNVIADPKNPEKEIATFVKGKTAMIFGYSYLYEEIKNLIKAYDAKNTPHIKETDIKIALAPQVFDPEKTNDLDTYASYFSETVARTSKHPEEAWQFILFLSSKENQQYYNEKTHKPTSRRDLIQEQTKDPIYGIFAQQIGYAKSLIILDKDKYDKIFAQAIDDIINTVKIKDALKKAEEEINSLIPPKGLFPKNPKPVAEE